MTTTSNLAMAAAVMTTMMMSMLQMPSNMRHQLVTVGWLAVLPFL